MSDIQRNRRSRSPRAGDRGRGRSRSPDSNDDRRYNDHRGERGRRSKRDEGSRTGSPRKDANPQNSGFTQGEFNVGPIIPQQYDLSSRKIYVGGIGPQHTDADVGLFLAQTLQRARACLEPGNPIIKTQLNRDKRYCFVELRCAEEAAALMQLDGIEFENFPLRIRRCQEYNAASAPPMRRKVP